MAKRKGISDIRQTKTTWDEAEANQLLADGWILLHASIAHKDEGGFQAKPCWILGKKEVT